jgi:hypothetical protein
VIKGTFVTRLLSSFVLNNIFMARPKAENPPKKIRYVLELSEDQHYLLKLKALNSRKTIKDLILDFIGNP